MNVTTAPPAALTTASTALGLLNNGRVPVIRGKTIFASDAVNAATQNYHQTGIIGSNNRGTLTVTATSGASSKTSSSSNSQNYIFRRSPNGSVSASNSTGGIMLAEENDETSLGSEFTGGSQSSPQNSQAANGLLVQYTDHQKHHHHKHHQPQHNHHQVIKQTKKDASSGMATIAEWLNKSPHQNGFIRVFLDPSTELTANSPIPPMPRPASPTSAANQLKDPNVHMTAGFSSILVPCSLSTTVEQVCNMIGISPPSLCVQINSGKVNKLALNDRPLQIQTNLLTQLGFELGSPEIMREGIRKSLSFICRFLSAKQSKLTLPDVCKRISSYLLVKRPTPVLKSWERRLCSLCGSKLQIHKFDQHPSDLSNGSSGAYMATTVFDLAGATITESTKTSSNRSHPFTVRIELSSAGNKRLIKLAFDTPEQKIIWTRHLKLAATNQSRSLDLSGCDLELLPEGVFQIAEDVQVLNLKDNQLLTRPSIRGSGNSDDNVSLNSVSLNPAVLGFLDDIARFRNIQILNLSNNDLQEIPKAVFELTNMTDLNIGYNKIRELSHLVQRLQNLKQLNCQSNKLSNVPIDMLNLRRLVSFNASFNRFLAVPETLARLTNMRYTHTEELQLAGNLLGQTNGSALSRAIIEVLEQVRKIDLRFNTIVRLVDDPGSVEHRGDNGDATRDAALGTPLPLASLQYCTILDLSFNRLEQLDLREMKSLETLNVNNNSLTSLIVNGTLLKNLNASYNRLEYLACEPNPDFLEKLDVSKNLFKEIPQCFHNCPFLVSANYGHNSITSIPGRYLFNNRRLRFLRLHCNVINALDDKLFEDLVYVEELYLHSNTIAELPDQLFNRAVKLKVLNLSKNRIRSLPRPLASLGDISRLQALYLSGNQLTDDVFSSLVAFPRLKFLHLARNRLTNLDGTVLAHLEFLQDLNVSENMLSYLPNELSLLSKLQTLRAHSNGLVKVMDSYLPEALQVLDLSSNRLTGHVLDIFPRNPLHLAELDLSGNAGLHFGDGEFMQSLSEQLQIIAFDDPMHQRNGGIAGANFGNNRAANFAKSGHRSNAFSVHLGTARTAGSRNKPSVFAKTIAEGFRSNGNESFAALFDGGLSSEVPKVLQSIMAEIVDEECENRSAAAMLHADGSHMKRAFLAAHRELKAVGQRLGATAAVCHFVAPSGDALHTKLRLFVGNVGDVEVLLCYRDGTFKVLTENFRVDNNVDDVSRAIHEGCVITDNCKLNGVAEVTRMLGCGYLFPAVIPSPNVTVYDLDIGGSRGSPQSSNNHATVVIANRNLWRYVTYAEVCQEMTRSALESPLQAAKRLLDLAQCFGSTENIGVVVAQVFIPTSEHNLAIQQNQQNEQAINNGHVMSVKPWTKERQNRKMAELHGAVLTQNNRTSTAASLRRESANPLPPAASLDFNPYGIAAGSNGGVEAGGSTERELNSYKVNGSRRVDNNDGVPSSVADNVQADAARAAVWIPTAVLHQYSNGASTQYQQPSRNGNVYKIHHANHQPSQPVKEEPQALSIRVDAADNPRKPRHVGLPVAQTQPHVALVPSRLSPPSNPSSLQPSSQSSLTSQPSSSSSNPSPKEQMPPSTAMIPVVAALETNQDVAVTLASEIAQPPITALTPESMGEPLDAKESTGVSPNSASASPSAASSGSVVEPQQQVSQADEPPPPAPVADNATTDESINSAVDTILLPPPAPYGDYEFVSYL